MSGLIENTFISYQIYLQSQTIIDYSDNHFKHKGTRGLTLESLGKFLAKIKNLVL